jgi:hypothetical protein
MLEDNIEVLRNFQIQILEKMVSGFESLPLILLEKCPEFDSNVFIKLKSLRQKLKAKLKLTGALLKRKISTEVPFSSSDNTDVIENPVLNRPQSAKSLDMHIPNVVGNNDNISRRLCPEVADLNEVDECYYDNDKISNRLSPDGADFNEMDVNDDSFSEASTVKTTCSSSDNYSTSRSPRILVSKNNPLLNRLSSAECVNSARTDLASLNNSVEEQALRPPIKVAFKFKTPTSFTKKSDSVNTNAQSPVLVDGSVPQIGDNVNKPSLESASGLQRFQRNHETPPRLQSSTTKSDYSVQQSDYNFNNPADQWITSFSYPVVEAQSSRGHTSK